MVARLGLLLMITGTALCLGALQLLSPRAHVSPRGWPREALTAFVISAAIMFLGALLLGSALADR